MQAAACIEALCPLRALLLGDQLNFLDEAADILQQLVLTIDLI